MSKVTEDPFAEWRAIQLTPEQKAEARAEAEEKAREAAAAGAYERFAELRGKVRWDLDLEQLRADRE
jgi:hypothetical protein